MRSPFLAALLLLPCISAVSDSLRAQNVTLLKAFNPRGRLSGVWGHATPDGREFALVGELAGTWIVETTDPKNPIERGHFAARSSRWRELTSYKNIVYSVSEHHRGIRVIDIANPSKPVDKGVLFSANIARSHSISIDPDAGRLYVNGTAAGMFIFDVSKNPASPTLLSGFRNYYVHDAYVRRGKGYFAEINAGNLRIVDITNASAFKEISKFQTPGKFTHSSWTTADDKLLVTTDENASAARGWGFLQVWDISNPSTPKKLGKYATGTPEICHNPLVIGRVCYMAYDSAGFHMCDLADPNKPAKLASYDTSASTTGYNGSWGCYPFQDSGVIYMSDRNNGLIMLQVDCGHMNRYGKPTAPTGHATPHIGFEGAAPKVGASKLELRISGLQPNAAFALTIAGKSVPATTILGVQVHVDLTGAFWHYGKADANGKATLPAPIPNAPGLGGKKVYMQLFGADAKAAQGFSASRGMWAGICK